MPPIVCTTVEPAKSRNGVFIVGEPAVGTPDPVADDRVDEPADADAVEQVTAERRYVRPSHPT